MPNWNSHLCEGAATLWCYWFWARNRSARGPAAFLSQNWNCLHLSCSAVLEWYRCTLLPVLQHNLRLPCLPMGTSGSWVRRMCSPWDRDEWCLPYRKLWLSRMFLATRPSSNKNGKHADCASPLCMPPKLECMLSSMVYARDFQHFSIDTAQHTASAGLTSPHGPPNKWISHSCGPPADNLGHMNVLHQTGWKLLKKT